MDNQQNTGQGRSPDNAPPNACTPPPGQGRPSGAPNTSPLWRMGAPQNGHQKKQQPTPLEKYENGRKTLLFMIILSAVTFVLLLMDVDFFFFFSLSITTILAALPHITGYMIMPVFTAVISALILGVFLLLYFLSKRSQAPVWVALGLYLLDSVLCFLLTWNALKEGDTIFVFNFFYHIMIVCTMAGMLMNWKKMTDQGINPSQMAAPPGDPYSTAQPPEPRVDPQPYRQPQSPDIESRPRQSGKTAAGRKEKKRDPWD